MSQKIWKAIDSEDQPISSELSSNTSIYEKPGKSLQILTKVAVLEKIYFHQK
jgi:hypothetical protein